MKKRNCACTVGQINQKTGELVPPEPAKAKEVKYQMIPFVPENVTQEMIDAQLGNSIGIKNKMDTQVLNREVTNIINGSLQSQSKQASGLIDIINNRKAKLEMRNNSISF